MRKLNIFTIALFLFVILGTSNITFADSGRIECGETVGIYTNYSSNNLSVTITVSDYCKGEYSEFIVYQSGNEKTSNIIRCNVPDGQSVTGTFIIQSSGYIELNCRGKGKKGYCIYSIDVTR